MFCCFYVPVFTCSALQHPCVAIATLPLADTAALAQLPNRRAYELAFSSTYVFAGTRPAFLEVERVAFKRPVDVGDLVRFRATVLSCTPNEEAAKRGGFSGKAAKVHAEVTTTVIKPESGESQATNSFVFV